VDMYHSLSNKAFSSRIRSLHVAREARVIDAGFGWGEGVIILRVLWLKFPWFKIRLAQIPLGLSEALMLKRGI
jgi:hypothetical protein